VGQVETTVLAQFSGWKYSILRAASTKLLRVSRTIWIGDVHGCADELSDLLDDLGPVTGDRVVFVGDLVARGPDTPGVIRLARQFASQAVLGNHEHRVILAREAMETGAPSPRLGPTHQALLHELSESDWAYLKSLPLSLEFPSHNVRVVHAGVRPGVAFEKQEPWTLLHIRSLTKKGAASDRYSSESWAASYKEEPHIVFGHNAQAGLQLHPFATGLDTACVYGGSLTALILEEGQSPPPVALRRDCLRSVPARRRHVDFEPPPVREPV
jgi:predicted MPP superfamily phosphohydrolase